MPPFNVANEVINKGLDRYFKRMALAREIDPEAFKTFHLAHFTDEQLFRQRQADERVIRDHPELGPPST